MHDVTDICMRLHVPPKIMFNQLDEYFSSLTNDYCMHENCCSMHSNMVAMLWCQDDTYFPYNEARNLILVTISIYGKPYRNWLGNTVPVSKRSGKLFLSQFC